MPEKIGSFQIIRFLGSGGYGHVYEGWSQAREESFAIKVLSGSESLERFKREAKLPQELPKGVVPAVSGPFYDGPEGRPYIVQEFLPGVNLEVRMWGVAGTGGDRLPAFLRVRYLCLIARRLKTLHERNIVHRDLKPSNIRVLHGHQISLMDLGFAKELSEDAKTLTARGEGFGTPCYAAPEQVQESKEADSSADIFSFGVIAHELMTGRPLFPRIQEENQWEVYLDQLQNPRELPVSKYWPACPPLLDSLVMRCLARNSVARPSIEELSTDLESCESLVRDLPMPPVFQPSILDKQKSPTIFSPLPSSQVKTTPAAHQQTERTPLSPSSLEKTEPAGLRPAGLRPVGLRPPTRAILAGLDSVIAAIKPPEAASVAKETPEESAAITKVERFHSGVEESSVTAEPQRPLHGAVEHPPLAADSSSQRIGIAIAVASILLVILSFQTGRLSAERIYLETSPPAEDSTVKNTPSTDPSQVALDVSTPEAANTTFSEGNISQTQIRADEETPRKNQALSFSLEGKRIKGSDGASAIILTGSLPATSQASFSHASYCVLIREPGWPVGSDFESERNILNCNQSGQIYYRDIEAVEIKKYLSYRLEIYTPDNELLATSDRLNL